MSRKWVRSLRIMLVCMLMALLASIASAGDELADELELEVKEYNERLFNIYGEPDEADVRQVRELHEKMRATARQEAREAALSGFGGNDVQLMTTLSPGSPYTFMYADHGDSHEQSSWSSNATTSYVLSQRRANVGSWASGYGASSGWAQVGREWQYSGSGSQAAYASFDGWYYATVLGAWGGQAEYELEAVVCNTTLNACWEQEVAHHVSTNNIGASGGDTFDLSVPFTATGGHSYVAYLVAHTNTYQAGPYMTIVESGTDDRHAYWVEIALSY